MTASSLTEEEIERLKKEMQEYASDITVGLCGRKPEHETIVNGSGSFVRFRDKYGILTAAHVWKKLRKFHDVQLLIEDVHSKIFVKLNDHDMRAWLPDQDSVNNTRDICFLQILNPNIMSTLKSKCTFYPLIPQTLVTIEPLRRNGWMLAGFPYQLQPEGRREKKILFCHAKGLKQYQQWDSQWDCLSFELSNIEQIGVTSVGGMSGGPVWAFQIFRSPWGNAELLMKPKHCFLAGVSYYEIQSKGQVIEILASGPNSIYSGLISCID